VGKDALQPVAVPRRFLLPALLVAVTAVAAGALVVGDHLAHGRSTVAAPAVPAEEHRARVIPHHVLHVPVCAPGSFVRLDSARVAYAVTVRDLAVAFRAPGAHAFARFGRLNVNGVPTVFAVLGARLDRSCRASWYRVQLPLRPNGSTGWVRATAVAERTMHVRIVVDLSQRRVTLYRGARPLLVTTAAIGSPSTPTPTGRYFVNQKLVAPDPLGPFGPAALGISAFSPVLHDWAQGGPIAIHGTNESALLGSAVSHGCIRVANDVVERLWKLVPTGTPVLIRM
jgi:lipoprotein-anchoring transpeptidase ErfK/SrfK